MSRVIDIQSHDLIKFGPLRGRPHSDLFKPRNFHLCFKMLNYNPHKEGFPVGVRVSIADIRATQNYIRRQIEMPEED